MSKNVGYSENYNRDITAVRFELPIFATYIDYTQPPTPANPLSGQNLIPHKYGETERRLYKSWNNSELKTNYWAGGHYSTSYHTDYYPNDQSRYWINSKGNRAISWDTDGIYYKGKGYPIVTYTDNPPHPAQHDYINCAAMNDDVITQADYDYYVTLKPSLTNAVVGKKRFVVIKNYYPMKLELWADMPTTSAQLLNAVKCYERELTELNNNVDNGFVFKNSYLSGFLGDGLSLIYSFKELDGTGNGNSTNDGLFKCVFTRDYTSQTFTKLADDVYPVVTDTRTLTVTPVEPEINEVNATITQTLVDGGLSIEQIFVHQDDVTVLMRTKEAHEQTHTYYRNDSTYVETINDMYSYISAFRPFKLVGNALVDTGIVLFRHKETGTETANDDSNGFNQHHISDYFDIDARCLFANAAKGLYIYQTFKENWNNSYIGSPAVKTVDSYLTVKTILHNNGVETVIDEYNTETHTSGPGDEIVNPANYSNSSSIYAEESSYINADLMSYSFDNKTLISCFNAHWQIGNTRPHTVIINANNTTQYTKLDYRVDMSDSLIFPLSVTN